MTPGETRFTHLAVLLVGGTGLVYGWMCYLARPDDPFAVVNHPWQPDLQHLHVLMAPLLVFGLGLLWRNHVWVKVRSRAGRQRWSGLVLLGLLVPMAATGYFVQVTVDEGWRAVWVWTHGISSCVFLLFYVGHMFAARRQVSTGRSES